MRSRIRKIINFVSNRVSNPVNILLYHRVTSLVTDSHLLSVSPDNFYDQISFLKRKYTILPPNEFLSLLKQKQRFPANAVLLTFDDGYADNYQEAIPILESLNAEAIFYITTSKLNTNQNLWWDELENILLNETVSFDSHLKLSICNKTHTFPTSTSHERMESHQKLHPLIKVNNLVERERIMTELRTWSKLTSAQNDINRLLTNQELILMSKSPACVLGAHTLDHVVLSQESYDEQYSQIKGSKDRLEELSKKKIFHFSYPFGTKADYSQNTIEICKKIGFEMVCSNYYGHVHPWSDPFQLPRVLVRNWSLEAFQRHMLEYFKW